MHPLLAAPVPDDLRCPHCPCGWHGLPCTTTRWDWDYHWAVACDCPTSFEQVPA